MFLFQGKPANELIDADWIVLMPNPHFNNLEKPLKLPRSCLEYMRSQAVEYINIWLDCRKWNYKPSDFRPENRIYGEDLQAMRMLDQWDVDGQKYRANVAKAEQENKEYIESEQARFKASKGVR